VGCTGKSLSTGQEVTATSDLRLSFQRNVMLEVAAMIASSSTNSKELTLITELTNKGPSDADGTVCGLLSAKLVDTQLQLWAKKICTTVKEKEEA